MKYTPDSIARLGNNEIFVFGSNLAGIHGVGAAKLAVNKFGAIMGQGEGLQGQSYAFPTKDEQIQTLSLSQIDASIDNLLVCCRKHPELTFYLTKVGCGLAGYTVDQIADRFKTFHLPSNLILPKEFHDVIYS
jgi:hypothetical protein